MGTITATAMVRPQQPRDDQGGGRAAPPQQAEVRTLKPQRVLGVAIAASLALWFCLVVTIGGVFHRAAPAVVLAVYPFDARAQSELAFAALAADAKAPRLSEAKDLASAALRRSPANVAAVRTLALVSAFQKDQERALHLFRYAHKLSRRDLATQLWLIEHQAASGSIEGALHHFDIALRTSRAAPSILFPVLISAAEDPAISGPVNKLLRQKPFWWRAFVPELVAQSKSPQTLVRVTAGLFNPIVEEDRAALQYLLNRLVEQRRPDLAWKAYREALTRHPGKITLATVIDGQFDDNSSYAIPPFGWTLAEDGDLSAVRQWTGSASDTSALFLSARNGRGGEVARQLLLLPSGTFRLSAIAGNVSASTSERPAMSIVCAHDLSMLYKLPFPPAGAEGQHFTGRFTVPSHCNAQWLRVELRSVGTTEGVWLDDVQIRPI